MFQVRELNGSGLPHKLFIYYNQVIFVYGIECCRHTPHVITRNRFLGEQKRKETCRDMQRWINYTFGENFHNRALTL